MKKFRISGLFVLCAALLVNACTEKDVKKVSDIDPKLGLTRDDYQNLTKPTSQNPDAFKNNIASAPPPIPALAPVVAAPNPPKAGDSKIVSISVTEDVPLKDVMIELARLADVDLEMDPSISGGIIFRATNRPFSEVIERISELAGLRCDLRDNILRVSADKPFEKSYQVSFLNVERSSKNNVTLNTNVLSSSGNSGSNSGSSNSGSSSSSNNSSSGSGSGSGNSGLNSGSSTSITANSESDLWKSFEDGIKNIINATSSSSASQGQGAAASTSGASTAIGSDAPASFYTINKQAGIITVRATEKQHRKVNEFIEKLKMSATSQVLIEAKIVEVTLDKEFNSGINWQSVFNTLNSNFQITANYPLQTTSTNALSFAINARGDSSIDTIINLTEQFGTSRTLSSPRLNAINNQQAVLTFAKNFVYFEIDVERESNTGTAISTDQTTVNTAVKTVPIGIVLNILPSINLDTNEVTLNVRPTLSKFIGSKIDPAVAYLKSTLENGANIPDNEVPEIEVRELDSIMKIKSGGVMVIGGILQDSSENTDIGTPGASKIPVLGNLFKSVNKTDSLKEMVIFIKATIIPASSGNVSEFDQQLYRKFTSDPRPL